MTIAEQQPNKERAEVQRYESRLERRIRTDDALLTAWEVTNLRWDATAPHVMPLEVILATGEDADESVVYEDTLHGRVGLLAKKATDHFSKIGLLPDSQMLMDSLVDNSIATIQRLHVVVPPEKIGIMEQAIATIGDITLQGIQLGPERNRAIHSSSNQYMSLLFSELDSAERTAPLQISSTDHDFMKKSQKDLSDYFHGRVELLLDAENDDDFMFIRKAVLFAETKHGDQKRFDGTPNREHILRLGIRLLEDAHFIEDPEELKVKLAAALLHDVAEDTPTDLAEIEKQFGLTVRHAVDMLSRYIMYTGEYRPDFVYFNRLQGETGYIADIKGHDRVDNLEALVQLDLKSQESGEIIFKGHEYMKETREYIPPVISDNPALQVRLAVAYNAVEQYYPSLV
jgi:hypothetical protein